MLSRGRLVVVVIVWVQLRIEILLGESTYHSREERLTVATVSSTFDPSSALTYLKGSANYKQQCNCCVDISSALGSLDVNKWDDDLFRGVGEMIATGKCTHSRHSRCRSIGWNGLGARPHQALESQTRGC